MHLKKQSSAVGMIVTRPPVSEGGPLHVVLAVAVDPQPAAPQRLGVGDVPRVVEQGGALILELETNLREVIRHKIGLPRPSGTCRLIKVDIVS